MRSTLGLIIGAMLSVRALTSDVPSQEIMDSLKPPGRSCKISTQCVTGCCEKNKCVTKEKGQCKDVLALTTVAEKVALRAALDDALSSAQIGSSCNLDIDCTTACCSTDGECVAGSGSQCGGPPLMAAISPPEVVSDTKDNTASSAQLGSICQINSVCQSRCCSRIYGICMAGEGEQCLP